MEQSHSLVTLLEIMPHTLVTLAFNWLEIEWLLVHKLLVEIVPPLYHRQQIVIVSYNNIIIAACNN